MRRGVAVALVFVAVYVCRRTIGVWRIRLWAAAAIDRLPRAVCPPQLRILPPPAEYAGVWAVSAAEARRQLVDEFGFAPLARAYLHAHGERGDRTYEVGSCVRRPEGRFGEWQLHVRLFSAPSGTELWAHWEPNPYVAPLAHLREEGYDPAEGCRRIEATLSESLARPGSTAAD